MFVLSGLNSAELNGPLKTHPSKSRHPKGNPYDGILPGDVAPMFERRPGENIRNVLACRPFDDREESSMAETIEERRTREGYKGNPPAPGPTPHHKDNRS